MVRNIIRSYTKDREQGWNYDLVMEKPLGSLRQRPYMRGEAFEKTFSRT